MFCERIGVFLVSQYYDPIFTKIRSTLIKEAHFGQFFRRNYKSITLTPGYVKPYVYVAPLAIDRSEKNLERNFKFVK
jgi:hypothetical protein